ncbi:MAG TPA: hypothetical protein PLP39_01715 [Flavobacterium lutivivi]|nr:hypothetical protein [Flavobacterium lutivivi]
METETNANFENFPYDQLTSSQNIEDFKLALANAGIVKYSELGDLLLSQAENAIDFQTKNKDFILLKPETKQTLIIDAVDIAINENPLESGSVNQSMERISCYQQYMIDRARCNRNNNVNSLWVASSFLGGPVAGGLGCLAAMWISKNCFADALQDYNNCVN